MSLKSTSHHARVQPPTFTGEATDWPLFSRKFRGFLLGDQMLTPLLTDKCEIIEKRIVKEDL